MFFDNWDEVGRIVTVGTLFYLALLAMLRFSGKRTLSRMSAFDMVITMAIGSVLGKVLIDHNVTLADGIAAAGTLIALQIIISMLIHHFPKMKDWIISPPTLLYAEGRFLERAMRRERICKDEICSAVKEHGLADFSGVQAVILGSNGQLSVIHNSLKHASDHKKQPELKGAID